MLTYDDSTVGDHTPWEGKGREGKGGYSGRDIETLRSGSLVEPFTTLVRFFRQRVLYAKVDQ